MSLPSWVETELGWKLNLNGSALPRIEVRRVTGTWFVCVLAQERAVGTTGRFADAGEARRAAILEAQAALGEEYQPVLKELLAECERPRGEPPRKPARRRSPAR